MSTTVRPSPCKFCPYRKDVPSGVWAAQEYAKLLDYDKPTAEQPFELFGCHETGPHGLLCAGWAQCHTNRGHEFDLLALRIHPKDVPAITTPLFGSGAEAAAHGLREIARPNLPAYKAMRYVTALQGHQKRRKKKNV